MVQEVSYKAWQAETKSEETKSFIRQVKRITRRKFTPEEKIRIVLEGFRHEVPVTELYRREGIRPNVYYSWLKDFMESGKERLKHDAARDATRAEVEALKRENLRLKQLVAKLSLQVHVLKKWQFLGWSKREVYARVSASEKAMILSLVAESSLPRRCALAQLDLPKSTYYRWVRRQVGGRLHVARGGSRLPWNRLRLEEEERILSQARASPELNPRQLALTITDSKGCYVSESTVYCILKREGLIKSAELVMFKAGKEYHRKTKRSHEFWATDCAYLKVMGWGWYYLVTVMDDFSRFTLSWKLQLDMTADSLIDVVQEAVDLTGMTYVPAEDRTALLSDNGAGYLSRKFGEYLRMVRIRHIIASPYHPQTNGKIGRYHRTIKGEINLLHYDTTTDLEAAINSFIQYYNYQRYHKALGDVTPHDVYTGQHLEILQRRKKAKSKTLEARRSYNRTLREQGSAP